MKLTVSSRNALPDSAFALPGRRYPIHDANHARDALARVSQFGTAAEKATVRRKVAMRFPSMSKAKPVDNMARVLMSLGR
jgi:hypothetical protein